MSIDDLTALKNQLLTLLIAGLVAGGRTHGSTVPVGDIDAGGDVVLQELLESRAYNSGRPKDLMYISIQNNGIAEKTEAFQVEADKEISSSVFSIPKGIDILDMTSRTNN